MASDITLAVGDSTRRMTYAELADTTRDPAMSALQHAVERLCEQLENANRRADRAEERADLLQVKFEAGALAERIARDEAARLRAELDADPDVGAAPPAALGAGAAAVMAASQRSRMAEHPRPALRVIEGGRTQLIADVDRVAEDLRELEARLATGRKELRLLLAALGPVSTTMSWRQ